MLPPIYQIFANVISPLLIGTMAAYPLFGIAVAQTIFYFRTYPKDHRSVKACVALLIVLDAVHTICISDASKTCYLYAKMNFVEPLTFVASIFISFATTAAFTYRVWLLSKNKMITAVLIVLIAIQFGSGMSMASAQINVPASNNRHDMENLVSGALELCSAILCDILISVALVHLFRRSRSGVRRSQRMIDLLIIYAVGIGSLTVIVSILDLVTWLSLPTKFIYAAFHIVLSKLYVNSLLVTLNSRNMLRSWGNKRSNISEGSPLSILGISTTTIEAR
ncbi:hypothetical protein ONZ45_g6801 [Pleurotus djamor]|nr:hypothetical protein ONZ45_g6801 [Pleurotus djamor]